jgi:hypothetical protein
MNHPTRAEIRELARNLTPIQRKMAAILDRVNGRQSGDEFRRWAAGTQEAKHQ